MKRISLALLSIVSLSLMFTGCTSDDVVRESGQPTPTPTTSDESRAEPLTFDTAKGCKNDKCDNQRNCKCVKFCNCNGTAQCKN